MSQEKEMRVWIVTYNDTDDHGNVVRVFDSLYKASEYINEQGITHLPNHHYLIKDFKVN